MEQEVKIIPFQAAHQNEVSTMMESISLEFKEQIFSTQSKKIIDVFELPNNKFWVAAHGLKIVGTIGLSPLANQQIVLKSMFVDKLYRGQGVSSLLLNTLLNWATENNYKQIYLGTMTQFEAGQHFYLKNGFKKCTQDDLPVDFIVNPLDTIFYTKEL